MTTTRTPPPRRAVLAALLAVLMLLTGCTSLPRTGPVTASDPDLPAPQGIGLFATGPQPGATPEEIVDGFLTASSAGIDDDFFVARQFLAGPALDTWQPLAQVHVYADAPAPLIERADDGGVRVSMSAEASLDAAGRYTEAAETSTVEADFTLARNQDGEWRIVELADGILITAANFNSLYSQSGLYFLSPDQQALVPEARWFPSENLATSLVSALLEGPSPWLQPGVTTAVPVGTRLVVESVQLTDGIASVDLSADALAAEGRQRAMLYAQIEATLAAVPGVQDVEIRAAGAPFELNQPLPELTSYPYTSAPLTAVRDDALVEVVQGARPRAGSELLAGIDPRDPALGYETPVQTAVVLDGTDRLVTVPATGDQSILLTEGPALVPPSVDRLGWVWTTPEASDGTLTAVRSNGEAVSVDAPWLADGTVRAVRVSRDGARIAVVWESEGSVMLDVAAIVRQGDMMPVRLGEPLSVGETMTGATDIAWVEESMLAVLGTSPDAPEPTVHLLPIGGPTTTLEPVPGAVKLTAGRGDRSLVLTTQDGRLYERNGAAWRPTAFSRLADPALPG
ncbi:LpqB family beta-propeller domain-containing protein [Georgenia alba]|uniref:LpqB family beta-propeller domain-containing protein n=1 Tax=Georgenia alba TaxID=2233858 RepID=A0ABW2QAB0_9MICO